MNKYTIRVDFTCPEDFFPLEKQEFRLSRYALSCLSKELLGFEALEIVDHDHLKLSPKTKVSISHTKEAACCVLSGFDEVLGLGIDIESKQRKYRSGIEKFFKLAEDDQNLSLIELWCAKEAAYKAYFPHYNESKTLIIKDFTIKDSQFYAFGKLLGRIDFKNTAEFILAIATLERT